MKFLICLLPIVAMVFAEDGAEKQLVQSNMEFSAKLFQEVAKSQAGKSVVMSGFSALSPLAQLALASAGDSHDEILKVIGMPNDEVTKQAFAALNTNLRSVKGITLKVANSVFIPEKGALNETFAQMSRDVFSSDVKSVNFAKNTEAAATINSWVEDHTNNLIKDLVDPNSLDQDTRAVLVNAIYFKGNWEAKFDKALTKDRDFHVSKEKTIQVPTMFKNADFKYGYSEELKAKLLELPYEGGEASFLIVLPDSIDGIGELQQKLADPTALQNAKEKMYTSEVEVYLPKFKIETTIKLTEVLPKIGVKKLFSGAEARIDYLIRGESDLFISDAIQKAFIEVNEEGAEAAAASAFGIAFLSAAINPPEPIVFKADHPFIFFLKDQDTTLFSGAFYQ